MLVIMKPSDHYHKWIEWSEEDGVYLGHCPDVITGIHGNDPVALYKDLCQVVDEVLTALQASGRALPKPKIRPMQEVV